MVGKCMWVIRTIFPTNDAQKLHMYNCNTRQKGRSVWNIHEYFTEYSRLRAAAACFQLSWKLGNENGRDWQTRSEETSVECQ